MAHIAAHKHELRASISDACYRFLKENAGAAGIGEFLGTIVLAYQKQTALDEKLSRMEKWILELLDRK